jgi:4a-hydroxytetrahydrobiopterin dehydratase
MPGKILRSGRAERVRSSAVALLSEQEVNDGLTALPKWERRGDAIERQFDRGNFVGAVEFVNAIVPIAEEANHHPDVAISWKDVTITLSTHSAGGITADDLALAAQIDALKL